MHGINTRLLLCRRSQMRPKTVDPTNAQSIKPEISRLIAVLLTPRLMRYADAYATNEA